MLRKNDFDQDPLIDVIKRSKAETVKFIDVTAVPFRCILMSNLQLKSVAKYAKNNKELRRACFDASGTILSKLDPENPEMLLYFLIFPMKVNANNSTSLRFNMSEFISETQTSFAIETFLRTVAHELNKVSPSLQLIHEVVTDWSWAEMNAVIRGFNNMSVKLYLELTFTIMTTGDDARLDGLVVLLQCSSHLTKSMSSDLKIYFDDRENQKVLSAMIGQIFNCICWAEIESTVKDLIIILQSPRKDKSFKLALHRLGKDNIETDLFELDAVGFEKDDYKQIYADSPFYQVKFSKTLGRF